MDNRHKEFVNQMEAIIEEMKEIQDSNIMLATTKGLAYHVQESIENALDDMNYKDGFEDYFWEETE